MQYGKTEVKTCELNGWGVGTVLEGTSGGETSRIRITALGEDLILARRLDNNDGEFMWTLTMREWRKVEP